MDFKAQAKGIGALAEPARRALYEFVVAQPEAVSREAAAIAVEVPVHTAKFHLDRMVDAGLLEVEYRRTGGRSGPGAGRPAKLYRRAFRQFAIFLPERRYDLVGHILAIAVQDAASGATLEAAIQEAAHAEGHRLGMATADLSSAAPDDTVRLATSLATQGYEPRTDGASLILANCPFDSLAKQHTELVCGLNRSYVQGVIDGLGCRLCARLEPVPGLCCVKAAPLEDDAGAGQIALSR